MSKLWNNFNDQYNINIFINLQSMGQYCYCLYFLNSKALVLFQFPFINYRLINRYRPLWSNLAIGIGIIHYRSTSIENHIAIPHIYLFGTMITGLLLIGLGFTLGYRNIRKTGTAVQSLTRLPVLIEAVGRAVSNETETINRNMDAIMMKLTALQVKLGDFRDQNGQREWAVEVCSCSPQMSQQFNLIFSGSPYRRLGQGHAG